MHPALLTHGKAVEGFPVGAPLGVVLVHQGLEASIVGGFQEMHQLVNNDVFEALGGLFGEVGIEADAVSRRIATAPLGLHALDEDFIHFHIEAFFPAFNEWGNGFADLVAIPFLHKFLAFLTAGSGPHLELHALVAKLDGGWGGGFSDVEEIALAPDVVALAFEEFTRGFALLLPHLFLLPANPTELGDGEDADTVQIHVRRCGNGHAAGWRVDAEVSDDTSLYPVTRNSRQSFIAAENAHDIRLSGKGIIDGQGAAWWKAFLAEKSSGVKNAPRRPQLIAFNNCERIDVDDITTLNPPDTHYSFRPCWDLTIRNIKAEAPDDSANTDALKALPDPRYAEVQHGHGVWAPAFRHHAGKFWIVFPTPDEGIHANASNDWFSLSSRPGRLRLNPRFVKDGVLSNAPNVLLQKFPAPEFSVATRMELPSGHSHIRARLVVMGERYAAFEARREDAGYMVRLMVSGACVGVAVSVAEASNVTLMVRVDNGGLCRFGIATAIAPFYQVGPAFQAVPGVWIGAKVSLFCIRLSQLMEIVD